MNKTIIALDTNIWMYLTKFQLLPLLERLSEEVSKGELEILVNDIILLEWSRNRPVLIKSLTDSIAQEYQTAKHISHYMNNVDDRDSFLKILNKYSNLEERIKSAEDRVLKVEKLMDSCACVKVSEKQKLYVANLAINKKPPFNKSKNNFNDALIMINSSVKI